MNPRTFEDWLRELVRDGGTNVRVVVNYAGQVVLTLQLADKGPRFFRVQESRVEPVTFDTPDPGGSDAEKA